MCGMAVEGDTSYAYSVFLRRLSLQTYMANADFVQSQVNFAVVLCIAAGDLADCRPLQLLGG
jgi:hypothetical protein